MNNGAHDWGSQEVSVWELGSVTGAATRLAQVNRNGSFPAVAPDSLAAGIGAWKTSGLLAVSDLYNHPADTVLFITVQAHGTRGCMITSQGIIEGGTIQHLALA